jgi:hypothetical protein
MVEICKKKSRPSVPVLTAAVVAIGRCTEESPFSPLFTLVPAPSALPPPDVALADSLLFDPDDWLGSSLADPVSAAGLGSCTRSLLLLPFLRGVSPSCDFFFAWFGGASSCSGTLTRSGLVSTIALGELSGDNGGGGMSSTGTTDAAAAASSSGVNGGGGIGGESGGGGSS